MSEVMEVISCNGYARGSVTLPMECSPASGMSAFWLQMPQAKNTAFTSPLRSTTWLAQTGGKGGKTEKKDGKKTTTSSQQARLP